ncbi:FAD-dependent monooxygenase [Pseudomonas sp. S 311-6]|nr:FAD-dependent monooxygenase [Pseudomonas sp. S 311-6]
MKNAYEVIVVGTGPAGLLLANILGRNGVRTLVLERDAGLSGQPKALNVDDEFFRLLHTLGLGPAMRSHAKFPISYDYISPLGQRLAFIQGRDTEHNFPNRAAIFQPEFERFLADHAMATGHVTILFDREVQALQNDGEIVSVRARNAAGADFEYTAQYAVGADGGRSTCRKLLNIPLQQIDPFDVRHVVVDVRNDVDDSALALTKMGWRRNFFSMPAPNGRRFEFSLLPGESAEQLLDDATLRRLFRPWRNYDQLDVIRKVVHTFRSCIAETFQQGRVFLVGDAAHLMPIFGSQGMNSGARDANNLGWKLVRVLRHGANPEILDSYQSERWNAVLETIRMATANGKLQRVKSIPMSLLRDLVFGVLRLIPPAQRYIREMRYIPKPFLRSPLIAAGRESGQKDELIGRVAPNPSVHHQGTIQSLDDLAGYGFAIIGLGVATVPTALARLADVLQARIILLSKADQPQSDSQAQPAATSSTPVPAILTASLADHRFDAIWQHYSGQWLLQRPDRIIAAAGPNDDFAATVENLTPLLSITRQHIPEH